MKFQTILDTIEQANIKAELRWNADNGGKKVNLYLEHSGLMFNTGNFIYVDTNGDINVEFDDKNKYGGICYSVGLFKENCGWNMDFDYVSHIECEDYDDFFTPKDIAQLHGNKHYYKIQDEKYGVIAGVLKTYLESQQAKAKIINAMRFMKEADVF